MIMIYGPNMENISKHPMKSHPVDLEMHHLIFQRTTICTVHTNPFGFFWHHRATSQKLLHFRLWHALCPGAAFLPRQQTLGGAAQLQQRGIHRGLSQFQEDRQALPKTRYPVVNSSKRCRKPMASPGK